MKKMAIWTVAIVCASGLILGMEPSTMENRYREAQRQQELGNYRYALDLFKELAVDPATPPREAADSITQAAACMWALDSFTDVDALLDRVEEAWSGSWRVAAAAAMVGSELPHMIVEADGRYERVMYWNNAARSAVEQDRIKAIKLMIAAEDWLNDPRDPASQADTIHFYGDLASVITQNRLGGQSWRLTALTVLDPVPELQEERNGFYNWTGAPVDQDGKPVFHHVPASWDAAANDGERWRWALARMAQVNETGKSRAAKELGEFLYEQFGVQTLAGFLPLSDESDPVESNIFSVRTLTDEETIARLATGIKRFTLPEEFNFIHIFQQLSDQPGAYRRYEAVTNLARIYENRQQFPTALQYWEKARHLRPSDNDEADEAIQRIAGAAGRLELGAAGTPATLSFLFRNATAVDMVAQRLDERRLLSDIRQRARAGAGWYDLVNATMAPMAIGRLVVEENRDEYIREEVAAWQVQLDPLPDHRSRLVDITLPFTDAGCYLITATLPGGTVSRMVVWLADLSLVQIPAGKTAYYFLADAASGKPVPAATVTFTGLALDHNRGRSPAPVEFARKTDADGLVRMDSITEKRAWLVTAETGDGRLVYLGPDQRWAYPSTAQRGPVQSAYVITDRPVYRPGDAVKYSIWLGNPDYGKSGPSYLGNRKIILEVKNPLNQVIHEATVVSDEFGQCSGELQLGSETMLGMHSFTVRSDAISGFHMFRVEEYRNPEFEVTVAVESSVTLGEAVKATVEAKYYFGAPVANGTVRYTIRRTGTTVSVKPPWPWRWLYDADPWNRLPAPGGWSSGKRHFFRPSSPPELVGQGEGVLDDTGRFSIVVDTLPARELFSREDHRYTIEVEVTDLSRRTITAQGSLIAARQPLFSVAWADKGYYRTGEDMVLRARTVDANERLRQVQGEAVLKRLRYRPDGSVTEDEMIRQAVKSDSDGGCVWRLTAKEPGQYQAVFYLRDTDGHTVEASTIITVRGEHGARDGDSDFRFTALELIPDRQDYKPGETVRLAVNSQQRDATVLLLIRAERGEEAPQMVNLDNGSAIIEVPVGVADQPNFFCTAMTVYSNRFHSETTEIFVPPADQSLNVTVQTDASQYQPGQPATVTVEVTDADGLPVEANLVVSMYDRSVEYISGGSNVPDIREFFWRWKRYYSPSFAASLSRSGTQVSLPDDRFWQPIGIFGNSEADYGVDEAIRDTYAQPMARIKNYSASGMVAEASISADFAVPMPAPPMKVAAPAMAGGGGESAGQEPVIRSDFANTAFWAAAVRTDAKGRATFTTVMPDSLTAWKTRVWTQGPHSTVGEGAALVETRKNLIVRAHLPRFLVQKDTAVLSALVHNYFLRRTTATVEMRLEGGMLEAADGVELIQQVVLDGESEARIDWPVRAVRPGTAVVTMIVRAGEESDAMEVRLPVLIHGAKRIETLSGSIGPDSSTTSFTFSIPQERLAERSSIYLSVSPTLTTALLEAVPYLVDYPYGCTEQTLNRFLPAVTVSRYLQQMGLTLSDVEIQADKREAEAVDKFVRRYGDQRRHTNRIMMPENLQTLVQNGVERLASMQVADGGWGWFSGTGERSWPHTTAVVVHGLAAAKVNGAAIPFDMLERGVTWLRGYRQQQVDRLGARDDDKSGTSKRHADNMDAFVHMILTQQGHYLPAMRDYLFRDRLSLSAIGLSMLGIALAEEGATDKLSVVLENLEQFQERNPDNGTVRLRTNNAGWWWYHDPIETQAWYLILLVRTNPGSDVTAGLAQYIVNNRRNGSYWRSTRDTALAIQALTEYAAASGELEPDGTVSVFYDGQKVLERRLTRDTFLDDHSFQLDGLAVEAGEHTITVERSGRGRLYISGAVEVFSLEDAIAGAGKDLTIQRTFFRLHREETQTASPDTSGKSRSVTTGGFRRERITGPFDMDSQSIVIEPGDLIEVELRITAANDFEYIIIEDMKAAGLESVAVQSGYSSDAAGAYVEYRDQTVTLFLRRLTHGTHTMRYRFRAETPGTFSALPAQGGGMYAPELSANSDEMSIDIRER